MAKTAVSQWSTTRASNSDIDSINIAEGCPPGNMNDAVREIMVQVKEQLGNVNVKGADLASATTLDLSTATGAAVDVTGTTTITGLGTVAAGHAFILQFDGALTFTHNATSLKLPGAANITTAAGDSAFVVSEGSGNWRCVSYQRYAAVPLRPQSWELIEQTTVSGTPASLPYTGLSAFRKIRISGFLKPSTDAVTLGVQTSSDNGSSYDSGASDYAGEYTHAASTTQTATSTATPQVFINYNANVGNAANEGIRFDVEIDEFNQSAYCYFSTNSFWINETGSVNKASNGARRLSATARDAFRLIFGTGTVASGFVTVEGIRG